MNVTGVTTDHGSERERESSRKQIEVMVSPS
jgi:hypothetical protein